MAQFEIDFPGNKKVDIRFGNFQVKTDQSRKNDGDETAPEPFDLFLCALGSCAGIYAKSFCDTRDLPTDRMKLALDAFFKEGQRILERVEITLYVTQAFPEKYIKPVMKSMAGCTVKTAPPGYRL